MSAQLLGMPGAVLASLVFRSIYNYTVNGERLPAPQAAQVRAMIAWTNGRIVLPVQQLPRPACADDRWTRRTISVGGQSAAESGHR